MKTNENIILKAKFHPVLKTYLFIYALWVLLISIVGIPIIPIWLLIGYYFCKKYFDNLELNLSDKTLELKKGYLFKVEKTIPLDKIQDLTLREGPLLRAMNLAMLEIETAGQSGQQSGSDAKIIGILDIKDFRNRVLAQRDSITSAERHEVENAGSQMGETLTSNVLVQIRDTLYKIEKQLSNK